MDMTCSKSIREEYYKYLNMMPVEYNQKSLLLQKKSAIKGIDYILKALENVKSQSYPISLRKIKNALLDDISDYVQ
ncbi:hypothetical protein ACQKP0_16025 [Heyndrickxia sp. NPDC080065]|uniref:hypothetical protein n=1 Tax=Heyndrickxia sp. NPDC080065 TaxID=3390568 RepID=UPI003CFE00AE